MAHYSTEAGLETEENVVLSWTPMDAKGSLLPEMKLQSTARGQGKPDWISYDSANQSILFDDSEVGADGRDPLDRHNLALAIDPPDRYAALG